MFCSFVCGVEIIFLWCHGVQCDFDFARDFEKVGSLKVPWGEIDMPLELKEHSFCSLKQSLRVGVGLFMVSDLSTGSQWFLIETNIK